MTATIETINNVKCLVLTVPMREPQLSKTEKTLIVAKTESPTKTNQTVNGKEITVSLSAWIKKD